MEKMEISTNGGRSFTVHIQGDLTKVDSRAVFLTVHDMGSNHSSWVEFVSHPVMLETKERSVFIHVDIPGQEDGAKDLPNDYVFPTMQIIAEDLIAVLDQLKVKLVIGLGEGAGANILARFGMAYPDRCMGLILIHCTSTTAGVMEHFKDKIISWKLNSVGMHPTAEQYLIFHKFGHRLIEQLDSAENKERLIKEYQDRLQSKINPKNLRKYVEAFLKRSDLSGKLEAKLKVETLLVTGAKASHVHTVHTMHQSCNKQKASLLKIDDVGDVLAECPEKFAQSMQLFCKGLGVLTSLPLSGVDRQRTFSGSSTDDETRPRRQRTMSMEEYDTPNLRRFSFSSTQTAAN
ncbi:uncharacterized protein ZK1073.1-like isoform X1 [Portunus trituberculatus]|uniref:uncharacterized protein ZK1073.1-like isoform X1 n=1 Tax=Portunus trituberculatus TaxID=210409 RepID=UPI001E1CF963|nr:uncharacterized protein ZK1073.1-like isoform X1 [Portunus trituberculatus]